MTKSCRSSKTAEKRTGGGISSPPLKMATFALDVTPPVGAAMAFSVNKGTASPIFIRGILLDDGETRSVLISCDFIYIWGQAWHTWRERIAGAASTSKERVFLHCVHQHDSMRIVAHEDMEAPGFLRADLSYGETTLERLAATVRNAATGTWESITRLMTAERRMERLASNRRLIGKDGKWFATRFSMCDDPELRALPVGTIDPLLRTVAFGDEAGRILAAIHFYATHPMTAYHRERVSADVPGAALAYAEERIGAETFQMYFTGCSGNVTLGKYFLDDKEESLRVMGQRLGEGMISNVARLEERPLAASPLERRVLSSRLILTNRRGIGSRTQSASLRGTLRNGAGSPSIASAWAIMSTSFPSHRRLSSNINSTRRRSSRSISWPAPRMATARIFISPRRGCSKRAAMSPR